MLRNSNGGRVLLALILFLCFQAKIVGQQGSGERFVSSGMVSGAKLKVVWQNEFPIREGESLDRLELIDGRIYLLSSNNYLMCLSGKNGNMLFSRYLAPKGLPIIGLDRYNKGNLFSIVGGRLIELDPDFGIEKTSKALGMGVTCPAARNSTHLYIAGVDRRMHVYDANNVLAFEVAAENSSAITSIIAEENSVVFGTDAGNVVAITPDRPSRQWRFDASDGIISPIVKNGEFLFFATTGPNVYKIDASTGRIDWKCSLTAILDKAPRVRGGLVYQYARYNGLIAIDKESGRVVWQVNDGLDLLSSSEGKSYLIAENETIVVVDNKKTEKLSSVKIPGMSKYAVNLESSRIYIADKTGRVACLEPVE